MPEITLYRTLPEQITHLLRYDLLSGRIEPGSPLRETEIAARFGVSRGPVREALRQLAQGGLLHFEPNRGFRTAERLSAASRSFFVNMRRKIELYSLRRGFHSFGEETLDQFKELLEKMYNFQPEDDQYDLIHYDLRFHELIIETHGDRDLLFVWQNIMSRMMVDYSQLGAVIHVYEEHVRIFDAIVAGDLEEACHLLGKNIH